ncbi:MAG: putative toxin-antitoxin system toxin component, family [Herminiimonas sp.]|nr:putative toxin-antitoxin system toxin component, family [Herminiimonas sp.]MDB5855881.1 putative toxin-antitoxin system toxin component, family [Herminiimonas sp.]
MIPNRIVLDTNVCLDLFVFHDPRWQSLLDALRNGRLEAVSRADCRNEWLYVLRYEHLKLDDAGRARAMSEFDALIRCVDQPEEASAAVPQRSHAAAQPPGTGTATTTTEPAPLPVCRDPDDQKFLELARDAGAQILITKDKLLLKLARKTARAGLFEIVTPQSWTASHAAPATVPQDGARLA